MNKLIIATILIFASIVSAKGAEFTKSSLEKLSDQELILKAIDSGNYSNIIFGGTEALNPDIPSYKKDLVYQPLFQHHDYLTIPQKFQSD